MQRLLSAAVALGMASAPVAAQSDVAAMGSLIGYPALSSAYNGTQGWTGGLATQSDLNGPSLALRLELSYGQLNGNQATAITPGPPLSSTSNFTVLGASVSFVWTAIGAGKDFGAYLIGGVGLYGIRSDLATSFDQALSMGGSPTATTSTGAGPGYNIGVGLRYTRFFAEARFTEILGAAYALPYERSNLMMVPLTIGVWF